MSIVRENYIHSTWIHGSHPDVWPFFWEKKLQRFPTSAPLKSHHVFLQAKFEGAYGKASWFTEEEDLGSGLFRQALVWRLAGLWFLIIKGVWWCLSEVSMKAQLSATKRRHSTKCVPVLSAIPFSTKKYGPHPDSRQILATDNGKNCSQRQFVRGDRWWWLKVFLQSHRVLVSRLLKLIHSGNQMVM